MNIKKSNYWKTFRSQTTLQVFAITGMLLLFVFAYLPMFGLIIAFKDYNISMGISGMFTSEWVGFRHFEVFFTDPNFVRIMKNTLGLSLLRLLFTFPAPIILALMLNEVKSKKFKKLVQSSSYLPYFISWTVVGMLSMTFFSSYDGVINQLLLGTGIIQEPLNILENAKAFWPLAIFLNVWKDTGWWTIIFLAAITGVDVEQYEAAQIDGATRLQRMRYITLPSIKPTIIVVLILSLGGLISSSATFEVSYLLGNTLNRETSEVLQTYVFQVGLSMGRYSYATAVGFFQSAISVTLVLVSNYVAKKVSGTGIM